MLFRSRARVVSALLVHRAHMLPQIARLPERSVAVRARVVSALLVHHAYMLPQIARQPKHSIALRARVVSALLVHRAHMHPQSARTPKRSVALRARVVFALLVHRAHMRLKTARCSKRSVALRARVVSLGPLDLLHLSLLAFCHSITPSPIAFVALHIALCSQPRLSSRLCRHRRCLSLACLYASPLPQHLYDEPEGQAFSCLTTTFGSNTLALC